MSGGLLLVGASGLAREVLDAGVSGVEGILDDDPDTHGTEFAGLPVLGGSELAAAHGGTLLLCIGPGAARRQAARRLERLGVSDDRFTVYAARSTRIGATCQIAPGSILLDGVVVTANARLGRHVVVMPHCTLTHDDEVGDFVTFAAGVALGGGVRIGAGATVGMNASVRQGVTIGHDATIGMGAVVLRDVPSGQTWAGVPARQLAGSDE
jgi:sugar O-acyltransferase, sialic acid O-acetyltransferase NeuD family